MVAAKTTMAASPKRLPTSATAPKANKPAVAPKTPAADLPTNNRRPDRGREQLVCERTCWGSEHRGRKDGEQVPDGGTQPRSAIGHHAEKGHGYHRAPCGETTPDAVGEVATEKEPGKPGDPGARDQKRRRGT